MKTQLIKTIIDNSGKTCKVKIIIREANCEYPFINGKYIGMVDGIIEESFNNESEPHSFAMGF